MNTVTNTTNTSTQEVQRGGSRSSSSLMTDSSEEERKPIPSPDLLPPRLLVCNPKPVYGPIEPLPAHLEAILEEWHRKPGNGGKAPPCKVQKTPNTRWRTFDRQGNLLGLSLFEVQKPARYHVLVLRPAEGPEKLVSSYFSFGTQYGIYLVAWRGVGAGFEGACCAVRKSAKGDDRDSYQPEAWTALDTLVKRRKGAAAQTETEQPVPQSARLRRMHAAAQEPPAPPAEVQEEGEEESSEEESGEESTSEEEEEEEEPLPSPVVKRRRIEEPSAPAGKAPKVVFKLVSYKTAAIRCFPLEECKSGKDLFDKARQFFQLFDKNLDVKILSCQIASQRAQQYVFEGSEGEFNLLVEQAVGVKDGDTVIVDVGHVQAL
ncbi:hypothetical protein BDV25DRAFT_22899 [Aspergillus avenaceus]|uniref:Uncharacterized protein n=1 Tax=Aspergillus avenaceus TaxID=36643 RepID=A0A5N6TPQ5_ASPAV|nr:hypothetical protein BDV25DRAFT_22899 [Aspergillus avenaceus]